MNDDIKIESVHAADHPDVIKVTPAPVLDVRTPTDWSHLKVAAEQRELESIKKLEEEKASELSESEANHKHRPFFFWFFVAGLVLLLLSGAFLAYKYYFDKSQVSSERISLTNDMPLDVKAGENNNFKIEINNGNKVSIKDVKVKFTYQKGFTREGEIDNFTKDFLFGDVVANGYMATSTEYLFIGSEGDVRKVKLTLTYRVENSNAEFNKTLEKEVKIITPLASVKISGSNDVIEDYENTYTFKVKNLSLKNFIRSKLVVEMPNGFVIKKNAEEDATHFFIENLPLGEEREYKVTGYFKNSIGETKNIRSYVAEVKENDETGSSYANDVYEVNINSSVISYKTQVESQGEKLSYFIKTRDGVQKVNNLELSIGNIGTDFVSDLNVILTNKVTKEEYKWDTNAENLLAKVNPNSIVVLTKLINNFQIGNNNYTLEVFGKRRGEFSAILLKKAEIIIEGK